MLGRLLITTLLIGVVGCSHSPPKNALRADSTVLEDRQTQSRKFGTKDEVLLLTAASDVLQDMGYSIKSTEKDLGLVTAFKMADAEEQGEKVASILLSILLLTPVAHDEEQRIWVNFVTTPSTTQTDQYVARVTFQRQVFNSQGFLTRTEVLRHPKLYQKFFQNLSQAIFMEATAL